jgi:hypothetical protein
MTITIDLKGRLGNQLFQYATLRNVSIKTGYNFFINTNIEWHGQCNILNYFNIAQSSNLESIQYAYYQPNGSNFFDDNIFNINDNTILSGHFENIDYFKENKDIIKKEITIKDESIKRFTDEYINSILSDGSKLVGIHFRRGDRKPTSNISEYENTAKIFINESLEKILEKDPKITIVIFTGGSQLANTDPSVILTRHEDDIAWAQKYISNSNNQYNMHISPGTIENNEIIDFNLLSMCDYQIIPNQSTFSFMSYYFSPKNVKVFSPTNLYGGIE